MFRTGVSILLILALIPGGIRAQNKLRFGSGVFTGLTLAQIDGDDMQGYDKSGINFGIKGMAFILPTLEFHAELSYAQQGSQSKGFGRDVQRGRQIALDYGSITGLITINDWMDPIKEYYRIQFQGGVSYGRLIRYETMDPSISDGRKLSFNDISPYFNLNDITMVLGGNVKFTEHLGIGLRYNRSMSKLIDADLVQPLFGVKKSVISMKNYFISFNAFYNF